MVALANHKSDSERQRSTVDCRLQGYAVLMGAWVFAIVPHEAVPACQVLG